MRKKKDTNLLVSLISLELLNLRSAYFLQRRLLVNIIVVAIFLLAIASILTTTRNAFPQIDFSTIIITTEYPNASPKDVEQNVTRLIEDELIGLSGIDKIHSVSAENVSVITVKIDIDESDQEAVKDDIRRAIGRVTELPKEVTKKPQVIDLKISDYPAITVGIYGDVDYSVLRQVAEVVDRDLKNIKGVSRVEKYGFREQAFHVELDPIKLAQYHVALNDVLYALESRNVRSTAGTLESFKTQRNIVTLSEFENVEQVRDVIVRSTFAGGELLIKDLAEVKEGFEDEKLRSIIAGEKGISLVVRKASRADIIRLIDRIYDYIEEKQAVLPPGVKLTTANDGSRVVRHRLNILLVNGICGFGLVLISRS